MVVCRRRNKGHYLGTFVQLIMCFMTIANGSFENIIVASDQCYAPPEKYGSVCKSTEGKKAKVVFPQM